MIYAEKVVTAIDRLQSNTRWRDFVDVYSLSGLHPVNGDDMSTAIQQVASYRNVKLVPLAEALDGWPASVQATWSGWHRRQQLPESVPTDFATVVRAVSSFADPVLKGEAAGAVWQPTSRAWLN
jgi:nucleotidyltransferase AbiEii toxin of type IV toxin-antitoxin system